MRRYLGLVYVPGEDEAAYEATTDTTMTAPVDLAPKVRELITRHRRRTA